MEEKKAGVTKPPTDKKAESATSKKPAPVDTPKEAQVTPATSSQQKDTAVLSSAQVEEVKLAESAAAPDSPTTLIEHDFLRPNFTLRLKPTVAVNDGEKVKLEVRFIAQPEPTVRQVSLLLLV